MRFLETLLIVAGGVITFRLNLFPNILDCSPDLIKPLSWIDGASPNRGNETFSWKFKSMSSLQWAEWEREETEKEYVRGRVTRWTQQHSNEVYLWPLHVYKWACFKFRAPRRLPRYRIVSSLIPPYDIQRECIFPCCNYELNVNDRRVSFFPFSALTVRVVLCHVELIWNRYLVLW